MQLVTKTQSTPFKNSETCTAYEYAMAETAINGAVIELTGRYPTTGRATNSISKELVYVTRGSGTIAVDGQETSLVQGDQILIQPGEKYYFNGTMQLYIACTPAWKPTQHMYTD